MAALSMLDTAVSQGSSTPNPVKAFRWLRPSEMLGN